MGTNTSQKADAPQPAAPATAAAPHALPAVSKLDPDSLSVVFSFLNTRDFLRAICVSRQWRAARVKRSAWPQLHLPTLIRALQDDDYDNSARRRLLLKQPTRLARVHSQPALLDMWRHVTDVKLVGSMNPRKDERQLQLLQQLPSLSALTLVKCHASPKAASEFCTAMAGRLQVLELRRSTDSLREPLGLLSSLRVLVLDRPLDAAALVQLHQLLYLHMETPGAIRCSREAMCAVRWLSVHHQLRSLQSSAGSWYTFALEELFKSDPSKSAIASAEWTSLAVHPPLDLAVKCGLTDLSVSGPRTLDSQTKNDLLCRSLPHLTRLQWFQHFGGASFPSTPVSSPKSSTTDFLSRLQEVRLQFVTNTPFPMGTTRWYSDMQFLLRNLLVCAQLRVLRVGNNRQRASVKPVYAALLRELLAAWAPTIEEMHFGGEFEGDVKIDFAQVDGDWTALAACHRLRAFSLQPRGRLPAAFLTALSTLPRFRSLGLSWSDAPPSMPTLLRCMIESRSWSELHLRSDFANPSDLLKPGRVGGLREQLAALQLDDRTAQRIRIYVHQTDVCVTSFHIGVDESTGKRAWQKEE